MRSDLRKNVRYADIGRVDCPELCALPGVLDDISLHGCKVHFDTTVTVAMDNDYELHIRTVHRVASLIVLLCHPQWVHTIGSTTEIGFTVLRSRDTARLELYVAQLDEDYEDFSEDDRMIEAL